MSGIAGLLDVFCSGTAADKRSLLETMSMPLIAGGSHRTDTWVDERAGIGLVRCGPFAGQLGDESGGPVESEDGRWLIALDGNVVNRSEVLASLGNVDTSRLESSDAALFVEAIARFGTESALDLIDGAFALGAWDREQRQLTLARDRMGRIPLCYGRLRTGEFVFGSTADVIAAHPAFDAVLDRNALALFFRYKYVPAPYSIYRGIAKLEPAHMVVVAADGYDPRGGEPCSLPYWSYLDLVERAEHFTGTAIDAAEAIEGLLRESVRKRLHSPGRVGGFLSGGIDSSTVVAIAQQESSKAFPTFTVGSADAGFDESIAAREFADRLGTNHTELMVTDAEVIEVIGKLGSIYDEPFADSSQIPTRIVCELARRDVDMALGGDGGDELFGGYNRYVWVPAIWRRLHKVPTGARAAAARAAERISPWWWDRAAHLLPESKRPTMLGLKMSKVIGIADARTPQEVYHRLVSDWQESVALVEGAIEPSTIQGNVGQWPDLSGIVEQMLVIDGITYLPDDGLVKVDRAARSVSLSVQTPLLDRGIVEFAAGLPISMKIRDGRTKWPMRQVLGRHLPMESFERPKSGFGIPLSGWLSDQLRDWAAERLFDSAPSDILDRAMVREAWDQHQSGSRDRSRELWDVVMFVEWAERRSFTL